MAYEKSKALFKRAEDVMPGGVNSPVRAFGSVGGSPVFFEKGAGSQITDVDGQTYTDFVGSWGPLILGYSDPDVVEALKHEVQRATSFGAPCEVELQLAELITEMVPSVEMVRMVNSGTEATMSAARLARAYTGRNKLIKFAGCYHGHFDGFLAQAGSGATTLGIPNSPGVSPSAIKETRLAEFNDLESVESILKEDSEDIAAIILEPLAANMGLVLPQAGFLQGLRKLADEHGALLIFDEVMTGFRVAKGGAQELYGVKPDLSTFGKVIGGGLPVGAYGGRKDVMETVAPTGPMYQAGTLSGNPLAMRSGYETLRKVQKGGFHEELDRKSALLGSEVKEFLKKNDYPVQFVRVGSMGCVFFNEQPVRHYADAKKSHTKRYAKFFWEMLEQGCYFPPAQFEAFFISQAHTDEQLKEAGQKMNAAIKVAIESA
jgi:glutamate-1-semialdehyde 2,1-aminomutase